MEWMIIDYEFLIDKDDFSIINFVVKKDEPNNDIYLESVKSFISGLKRSYKNKNDIIRQIKVDFPREKCYVNGIEIKTYEEFINEVENTDLFEEAIMICTQTSAFPITEKLFETYQDYENNIHVSDFREDNPLIFHFLIYGKDSMYVTIEKKFRIVKLKTEVEIIDTLSVKTTLNIGKEDNDVFYSIIHTGNYSEN